MLKIRKRRYKTIPIHDFECPACGFTEERFVRKPMAEYDPGICPNGCLTYGRLEKTEVDGQQVEVHVDYDAGIGVPLQQKFNPGNMAKPIYRGYGWHNSDYHSTGPK